MTETEGSKRILLVEDSPEQALLVGRWLGKNGRFQVSLATSVEDGLRKLENMRFDLVLSDVELPDGTGIDVVAAAKRRCPQIPTVLMTAHPQLDYALRAIQSQVDAFVVKPLTKDPLLLTVKRLLHESSRVQHHLTRTVLAIGAHPDNVAIGCGGALLRHLALGDRVVILSPTGGGVGERKARCIEEAKNAAQRMGVELRLGDLKDTYISAGVKETIEMISNVVEEIAPDIVFTHSKNDTHQDHRAVHKATQVACRDISNVLCYQSPSTRISFRPSLYIDIRDEMQRKLELVGLYAAQTSTCTYLRPDLIRATARYWGHFVGHRHVEPLEVVRVKDYPLAIDSCVGSSPTHDGAAVGEVLSAQG